MNWLAFLVPSILTLSLSATCFGVIVPDDACPNDWGPEIGTPECSHTHTCHKTDGPITAGNAGTPATALSTRINCENCVPSQQGCLCKDAPPPPSKCVQVPSLSFTETVTATVATSVTVEGSAVVAGVQAGLEASLGHSADRTITHTAECGTDTWTPCKVGAYEAYLAIRNGKSNTMTHTYQWEHVSTGCAGVPDGTRTFSSAGTDQSSVTGNVYEGTTTCRGVPPTTDCP